MKGGNVRRCAHDGSRNGNKQQRRILRSVSGPRCYDAAFAAGRVGMIEAVRRQPPMLRVVLYGGVAALAFGFVQHAMWQVLPWERLALSLLLALVATALAWPLRRFARWSWASSLALVWLLALVGFVGPLPVLAAGALAAAAMAVGLPWLTQAPPARLALATTIGLALIAGIGGWTLTWPIHTVWLWWAVVSGLLLWRRRALLDATRAASHGWGAAVAAAPRWAALAVMLLGLASTACWLPTMQADDLRYHLGLPSQLLMHAEYRPDPAHQIWALAPWAGDALQGFAALLIGQHARGAVNAVWLALAAAAIWSAAAGVGARAAERWACVALFGSLPPLVWMAAGMQTELPATAVLAALTAVIVSRAPDWPGAGRWLPGAVLLGALFALKGVHVLSALPLLAYAGWRHRRALPWRRLPLAVALVAIVGGSSYALSWWQTGNPVLPLLNDVFESPYYPSEAYRDPRWHAGLEPTLLWRIVFDTDRYVEAWDGGFGMSLIALSGAWLVALLCAPSRALALALSLVLVLPLLPMQYARYAYPGLALLAVALLPHGQRRFGVRSFRWVVIGACVLNLAFQANASWLHHSAALKRVIRSGGDPAQVYPWYVPERVLLDTIPAGGNGLVLATNPARGNIAELGGRGRVVFEHDPRLQAERKHAETDRSGAAWAELFTRHRVRWVLMTPVSASAALRAGLQQSATRVAGLGGVELWRVGDARATAGAHAP